ncbi:MAG TPA: 30S ribosomal protein S13 [Candidatus Paceibacterota bacterium]
MPRIAGINIPENKKIEFALPYIYGVGPTNSRVILKSANVPNDKLAKDLTAEEINRIQGVLDHNYKVEGDLRREVSENIKRLKEVGSWRGVRHMRRLPIHGRTKTNSRTLRGNIRRTAGSGRKPSAQKT